MAGAARMSGRYFHGGVPGLKPGQRLMPRAVTQTPYALGRYDRTGVAKPHRVYVTTTAESAVIYAVGYPGGGWLYEVEPIGRLTPDPDCLEPGLSWECARAVVVAVVGRYQ